jgi:site-specific recombinase XerD
MQLQELITALEHEMLRIGYKEATMDHYRANWRLIRTYFEQQGETVFSEAVGMRYLNERYHITEKLKNGTLTQSNSYGLRIIRMMGDYQAHGTILRRYHNSLQHIHIPAYETLLKAFGKHCESRAYSQVTKKHYIKQASRLLAYAESKQITAPDAIDAETVGGFIKTLMGYNYKTVELALCGLRCFFRFLQLEGFHGQDLSHAIPGLKSRKQALIPSVWRREDVLKLLGAIDRGNPAGKRDYAIIMLVTRLGIRTIDIKHLRFENLKWPFNRLEFIQSKTGRAVSLPLLKDVGWAIIDYLEHGRPHTPSPFVFLRHLAPIEPFSDEDRLHQMIIKYMRLAHVPIGPKRKVGMHSLRHTLASALLEQETPLAVISDVLGHIEGDSATVYLKTGIAGLRECALTPPGGTI